jgi:thymidylate synthase (FAD)
VEIRAVAVEILRQLMTLAPHVFSDFTIGTLVDGTEVAASPYAPS